MSENKEHPARGRQDKVDLSEGQRGKGVQVIQTAGLPQGYTPPSASLAPPTPSAADVTGEPAAEAPTRGSKVLPEGLGVLVIALALVPGWLYLRLREQLRPPSAATGLSQLLERVTGVGPKALNGAMRPDQCTRKLLW